MRHKAITTLALLVLAGAWVAPARGQAQVEPETFDNQGFLYGTVETASGTTYRGILRWGTEESFWDDHFNSTKEDLPHLKSRERGRRERIRIFGVTIGYRWDRDWSGRSLIVRFGDIKELELKGGDDVRMTMKNGRVYELDGGSNDIGAKITVHDASLGEVKLDWKKIRKISFAPTPKDASPPAPRLWGKVKSRDQTFEGYVQWDLQECLWTDELDGESEDGDLSIEMGKIRAIEKRNRDGSWVELKDGRRLLLEDTNDVDRSIDGIFVEDKRYGRVELNWDSFERVDFIDVKHTGRAYDDYLPARPLRGKVVDRDGNTYSGRLVYDLDESETWEMLNGDRDDVEYNIPFEMVRSVTPKGSKSSLVVLKNGAELELEDSNDVTGGNDGMLIIHDDGKETYVEWDDVQRVEFD